MTELKGAGAVVTGGAMGIGFETARRLLEAGCRVTIWDLNEERLRESQKILCDIGPALYCHTCDVSEADQIQALARTAESEMGQVDILINNAGCVVPGRFCAQPQELRVKETYVNQISMYYTTYAFLSGMLQRNKGHIVNISSGAGLMGMPDLAVYCATKWAVYGFTESLRLEALSDNKKGVRFSSVHPGIIREGLFEGSKLNLLGELLIPRINHHDEIAKVIVNKALLKNRCIIKYPKTLHLGPLLRALVPDRVLGKIMMLAGCDGIMREWKGRTAAH